MKRYLLLLTAVIAALAVVLPATAGAATFRGAVVAKDAARKALVTAGTDGTVRTVRLHGKVTKYKKKCTQDTTVVTVKRVSFTAPAAS